ncbi:MAG: CRTAC1 family protein [Calditrichaeota bacterium]|nr:CRTAC1 family protein [Calditrichota bacterium]
MKKILFIPVIIIVTLITIVVVRFSLDKRIDYDVSTNSVTVPKFSEFVLDFEHKLIDSESLPFVASAIIDVDNDGIEELFLGGGPNQEDVIYEYKNGGFKRLSADVFHKTELADATFGASVVDVDKNSYSDLIISRTNGVWLYLNNNGHFSGQKLDLPIPLDTSPLSVAIADINRDGHFDMYIAGYIRKELVEGQNIFNKEGYGGSSIMVINNGDNTFTDITESSGLYYKHNTFMGVFVDVDNDGLEDLVVAHDTGQVRTWKNLGNMKFKNMSNPNSSQYSYPMGIAVTDYKNNGLVDFFFSNVGSTAPAFAAKGDLRDDQVHNPKWIMFQNKGGFAFNDIAEQVKLADYEFSWGAIFEDFNLDGLDDLVVSENYIGFPIHKIPFLRLPGRFLIQTQSGEFAARGQESGVINTGYGISPITADFNNDGYPDLVHVNIAGNSKAFINKGGDANYLKVQLPNTIESIAAKIKVIRSDGLVLRRDVVSGEGLSSDQSHVQIFGLGDALATEVSVQYLDGRVETKTGNYSNTLIRF